MGTTVPILLNRVYKDKPGGLIVDYLGLADNLKKALAQYTKSDRENTGIDTSIAVDIMIEKYEILKIILNKFNYSLFFRGNEQQKLQILTETVDYAMGLENEMDKEFIQVATELARAHSLCVTTDEAKKRELEIAFFKAVKAGIIKLRSHDEEGGTGYRTQEEINREIKRIVDQSLILDGDIVIDQSLFKIGTDILSEEIMRKLKNLKNRNIAREILNRLLLGKIRALSRRNLVQSRKFSELLKDTLKRYQDKEITNEQVIDELIEYARDIDKARKRGEELGLNEDETAFFDALCVNDAAVKIMGDKILKKIAMELAKDIKSSMTIDWNLRESVRAEMRVKIKRLLKKYKYPPDHQKKAIEIVMEQAKLFCKEIAA